MTETERKECKKAYVELNEIIKNMSIQEKRKIPLAFMKNLNNEMDKDYKFVIDNKKSILEQNFKVETKALLVELYEKYLAPDEEKRKQYNPNDIFIKKNEENYNTRNDKDIKNDNLPIEVKGKNIFIKFVQVVKKIFHID